MRTARAAADGVSAMRRVGDGRFAAAGVSWRA
jgi:hypothetical protein